MPDTMYKKGVRYETSVIFEDLVGGKDDGSGYVTGYSAVFGSKENLDRQNQFIYPGAFAKTVSERIPGLPLMVRHIAHGGGDQHVIGEVIEGKEDDHGLWTKESFDDTDLAQKTREAVLEGGIQGKSIGYEIIKADIEKMNDIHIVGLKEVKLLDVIVTGAPANPGALILSAKSLIDGVEAACTGETSRGHFGKQDALRLSEELKTAAKRVRAAVSQPSCTAQAAAAHCEAKIKMLRLRL